MPDIELNTVTTEAQLKAVLAALRVSQLTPATKLLSSSIPFGTTLNSILLGTVLQVSSLGENVGFNNLESEILYTPPWSAVRDQSLVENQGSAGVVRAQDRARSDEQYTYTTGVLDSSASTDAASYVNDFGVGVMIFGYDTVFAEDIPDGEVLIFQGFYGTDASGKPFFDRKIVADGFLTDSAVSFSLSPHVEVHEGQPAYIQILRSNGDLVKSRAVIGDSSLPYFVRKYRTFEDKDLAYVEELPNTSRAAGYFNGSGVETYCTTPGTYYKVQAEYTVLHCSDFVFDVPTKRWVYEGTRTKYAMLLWSFTASHTDDINMTLTYQARVNGVAVPTPVASQVIERYDNANMTLIVPCCELTTGSYIELFVTAGNTTEMTKLSNCNFSAI